MIYKKNFLKRKKRIVSLTQGVLIISILFALQACTKPKTSAKRPDLPGNGGDVAPPGPLPSDLPSDSQSHGGTSDRPRKAFLISSGGQVSRGTGMIVSATVGEVVSAPANSAIQADSAKSKMKVLPNINGSLYSR